MKKPIPSDIKQSQVLGEFFFSRKSMKFFNQTMSDFKTVWRDKDNGILELYANGSFTLSNPVARLYQENTEFRVSGKSSRFIKVYDNGEFELISTRIEYK